MRTSSSSCGGAAAVIWSRCCRRQLCVCYPSDMSRSAFAVALIVLSLASCTSTPSPAPVAAAKPAPVEGLVEVGGGVLAWVSSPWTFSTTSYAIDAPGGLILIDTQFLPKEGLAFVDAVENHTGKKAVAA